ncbi:hypothetical protein BKA67DRAFT_371977 [Truncatella angustata]|uniref:Fucose-specific lectin n=1 Tax=Truncatella angustata TaxID=152316 RepID=A0A9P8UF36_9PEZI|nr:uncharacterized protein BKA67DRAFT_371977 [Truncatella angustata]KAH6648764.1 hypothetical protein BKA67DRAFT_371977 [Truncatella angustata]KAH8201181.1 hypothetical protein TruAng_004649 [Truncatella angustata]
MAFIRSIIPTALCMLATQVSAASMAAWWTDLGPSLLVQDDESGGIRYSLCTSQDTPILPEDKTITAPLYKFKPKNGTAIAGTGWWDTKITWASVFYQDESDNLINSYLKCDPNTGYWLNQGDWIISGDAPSVSSSTGLAAVLLGATGGYRVYYHDANMTIRQLGYTSDTNWADKGPVSQDEGLGNAIGAIWVQKTNNITVATAKDNENIEISRWMSDDSWHVSTFPRPLAGNLTTDSTNATSISLNETSTLNFTLPAWDGNPSSLGVTCDKAYTRSVFYIGTDSELYQIANVGYNWREYARPNSTLWPTADNAKGQLAVASKFETSQLRVYYESGGQVMELNGDNNEWTAAAVLPNDNSTAMSTSTPSSSANSSASASSSTDASDGLSTGAKVGVGVGVSLGVVALGGMLGALFLLRRRQRRRDAATAGGASTVGGSTIIGGSSVVQTPATGYSTVGGYSEYGAHNAGYQQYGGGYEHQGYEQQVQQGWSGYKPIEKPNPGELDSGIPVVHEMPEGRYHHEMMGEGHYREAP